MSQPLDHAKEIVYGSKPYAAFAEVASGCNFGFEFVVFAKEQALSQSDFAARTNQALPFVRSLRYLPGEQTSTRPFRNSRAAGFRELTGCELAPLLLP